MWFSISYFLYDRKMTSWTKADNLFINFAKPEKAHEFPQFRKETADCLEQLIKWSRKYRVTFESDMFVENFSGDHSVFVTPDYGFNIVLTREEFERIDFRQPKFFNAKGECVDSGEMADQFYWFRRFFLDETPKWEVSFDEGNVDEYERFSLKFNAILGKFPEHLRFDEGLKLILLNNALSGKALQAFDRGRLQSGFDRVDQALAILSEAFGPIKNKIQPQTANKGVDQESDSLQPELDYEGGIPSNQGDRGGSAQFLQTPLNQNPLGQGDHSPERPYNFPQHGHKPQVPILVSKKSCQARDPQNKLPLEQKSHVPERPYSFRQHGSKPIVPNIPKSPRIKTKLERPFAIRSHIPERPYSFRQHGSKPIVPNISQSPTNREKSFDFFTQNLSL